MRPLAVHTWKDLAASQQAACWFMRLRVTSASHSHPPLPTQCECSNGWVLDRYGLCQCPAGDYTEVGSDPIEVGVVVSEIIRQTYL